MNAEMKAVMKPTTMAKLNSPVMATGFFQSFNSSYAVAPPITGIAKKKENSVATVLGKPNNIPPIMVAPEREVPGIKAAHCANPTFKASQ